MSYVCTPIASSGNPLNLLYTGFGEYCAMHRMSDSQSKGLGFESSCFRFEARAIPFTPSGTHRKFTFVWYTFLKKKQREFPMDGIPLFGP